MRRLGEALTAAGVGLVRSTVLAALHLAAPLLAVVPPALSGLLGSPWAPANPWSWFGLALWFAAAVLLLARPVGGLVRRLLARWADLQPEADRRTAASAPEPVLLATGYWWNGRSYERSRRDAVLDEQWRRRLGDPAYWRDVRWLLIAAVAVGPVCALPAAGIAVAAVAIARATPVPLVLGVLLLIASPAAAPWTWRIAVPLAARLLGSAPGSAALEERVRDLEAQRADTTAAQAAELRRIERDLHDGAQARLVAVGLSLAAAERLAGSDPERSAALLREARAGTAESLVELRRLVRGIHPPVLAERGAIEAIRALALESPVDVRVEAPEDVRLEPALETAVYFSVAELLANAAKHAPAARVLVRFARRPGVLDAAVEDDGPGGAVVQPGGGLDGVRRRLAAFDGTLAVSSPPGGPTRARIEVPCASS